MPPDLRSWLIRSPKPHSLRVRLPDGEERPIVLGQGKTKWHNACQTVLSSGAAHVEALGEEGEILRSMPLTEEDREDAGVGTTVSEVERTITKNTREMAAVLDAYGKRMNDSFRAGSEAASQSQEALVALVSTLTQHLSLAITNLHNVTVNLVEVMQASVGNEEKPDGLAGLLGNVLAARGLGPAPAPAAAPTNGKGKKA